MTTRMPVLSLAVLLAAACGPSEDRGAEARDEPGTSQDSTGAPRVTLTPAGLETAGIQIEAVATQPDSAPGEALVVPGRVDFDPRHVALISSRIAGRVERLAAAVGDRVREGQVVAELFSASFVSAQHDLVRATQRLRAVTGTVEAEVADDVALAARRRLSLMGATDAAVSRVIETGEPVPVLELIAPFDGSIMEAYVLPGAALEAGAPVYRIADLSAVDVVGDVPERALPLVRLGQTARIEVAAYPGTPVTGRLERLHDELDRETRTVHAVIHVPNPSRRLRPGMYASVAFDLTVGVLQPTDEAPVLTIPESALVTDGEIRFVFVQVGPRTYERRTVEITSLAPAGVSTPRSARVAVRSGLVAGELVVVRGAFTLKSELAKAAFAEEEH